MKIVSADITGSLIINGVDVTTNVVSSSIFSGSIAGRVTNLESWSSSLDATYATDASVSASILVLSQSVQTSQAALSSSFVATSGSFVATSASFLAVSESFVTTSGSYAAASASLSTRVTNTEATASINTQASASFAAYSGSMSTRLTQDETNITTLTNASASFAVVSSSFSSTSQSVSSRVTLIEGQYATTGSNSFTGPQYISQASNAISFTSTASLYTDGGLRVAKDSYVSGTAYFNNITVYGTSSIEYITSSQVTIGTNIIYVNTDTPAVRFGGLAVFDSGSTQLTGSMLWDSEANHWVYSNPSGSTYSGGMIMSGPRASSLGTEQGTTFNAMMKGQGGDHITSSQMFDDGTTVRIPGNLQVTGSIYASNLTGSINGSNLIDASVANAKLTNSTITIAGTSTSLGGSITAATILSGTSVFSGSAQIPAASITNAQLANSTISGIALGSNLATLTIGTGLSGTSYNGSGAVTIANTGVTSIVAGTNISISGATGAVTITNGVTNNNQLTNGAGYITSAGTSAAVNQPTYTQPAVRVNASGTSSAGSSIAIQQITAEGWTGIFVDFEPNTGWGLYHDNPNNYLCVTAETTTGGLRSFTVPSRESGNRTAYEKIRFDQTNGSILAGGDITAFSDGRVKAEVKVIDKALEKVLAIRGVTFVRTDAEGEAKNKRHAGVIAQEVLEVLPEVVNIDKNTGMYNVAYGNMNALLIEAIKEQQSQIEELKTLINGLTK